MNQAEIEVLKATVKQSVVLWNPDSNTGRLVIAVSDHAEEGEDSACAIFSGGAYAALYNCQLKEFVTVKSLTLS